MPGDPAPPMLLMARLFMHLWSTYVPVTPMVHHLVALTPTSSMILMVLPLWSLWSLPYGSYGLPPYGPSGRLLMASFVSHLASRPCLGHQPLAHRGLPCCSIFSRGFP